MQLDFPDKMPIARAGMPYDSAITQDVISRVCENSAGARAGALVVPGTTDAEQGCRAPTGLADIMTGVALGVVVYDASKAPATGLAAMAAGAEFDETDLIPIFTQGRIWVRCDDTAIILPNTAAWVRYVAGAGERLGDFRQNADGADAAELPHAIFRSAHQDVTLLTGFSQRIALVELSLPATI